MRAAGSHSRKETWAAQAPLPSATTSPSCPHPTAWFHCQSLRLGLAQGYFYCLTSILIIFVFKGKKTTHLDFTNFTAFTSLSFQNSVSLWYLSQLLLLGEKKESFLGHLQSYASLTSARYCGHHSLGTAPLPHWYGGQSPESPALGLVLSVPDTRPSYLLSPNFHFIYSCDILLF